MTNTNELTAKLKAAEDLQLNAREVSNQLRHLADNEIDSDSFAVVTENYNGREVEFERPITDLALDAANVVDALTEALEAAEKRIASLEQLLRAAENNEMDARCHVAELEARTVNLSKRSVGEVMHMSGFSRDYAEGWCSGNDNARHEIAAAGIKLQIEGE